MSDLEKKIVLAFADNGMRSAATADAIFYHRNTITYHLERIHKKTGLDPYNFYDLYKLVTAIKTGEELIVCNT